MNAIEHCLREEATWIAERQKDPDLASVRLSVFRPKIGVSYQCPACWVKNEKRSALDPIQTNTRDDAFGCEVCGSDFLIPR